MPQSRLAFQVAFAGVASVVTATLHAATELPSLGEVVISASRPGVLLPIAQGIEAERRAALAAATSDSASLLRDLPGVSLYGAGGVSSLPVIHGLADDRLRTQVDGMDLIAACPNHMNPALSYIDPSHVERVQVYAGVTPVSVGGDSIGGSIVVESAPPVFAETGDAMLREGEIGGFYRSNGEGLGGNVRLSLAGEHLSLTYAGAFTQADNYNAAEAFKERLYVDPANSRHTGRQGHELDTDEVGSTAYKSSNQSLALAWHQDEHLLDLTYAHQDIPYENFPNQRMDMTDNVSDKLNLGYTGEFGWGRLQARVFQEDTEHEMDFAYDKRYWYGSASGGSGALDGQPCAPISSTCAAGMPMYTESKTTGATLKAEIPMARSDRLRIGAEFLAYRLDDWWPPSGAGMWPDTFWNIRDGQRDRQALFGEWEARLGKQWTTQLGLRHETVKMDAGPVQGYNSSTDGMPPMLHNQLRDSAAFNAAERRQVDHNWDYTLLARYAPAPTRDFEIGLARKTRSPNLYERYTWSTWQMAALMNNFVGDGNGYVGDIGLRPEIAHTVNLAADWHAPDRKAWGLRLSPYYTRVKDYIDAVQWDAARNAPRTTPVVDQFTVLKYVNQSARLYGLDLSGFRRFGEPGTGEWVLSGLLNYAVGENRDSGDNLYNIMPPNAKLALTREAGAWSATLEAQFVAAKDEVSRVRNEMETDSYNLFHLRGRYAWKHVRVDIGIENLFDTAHDLPLGGAYLGQGTTMTVGPTGSVPQWGTLVPGPGRSFYVGVNYSF